MEQAVIERRLDMLVDLEADGVYELAWIGNKLHSFNGRSIRDEFAGGDREADRKAARVTERRKRAG
jgi:hypothetical protein